MNLKQYPNKQEATKAVFDIIASKIRDNASKKEQRSIGFSGGSSPLILFTMLNIFFKENPALLSFITIGWVDERMVSYNNERSNYGNAIQRFPLLKEIKAVFPFPYISQEKDFSEENIKDTFSKAVFYKNGRFEFDISILGMGDDGHTASIFPGVLPIKKVHNLEFVKHPEIDEYRISLSLASINLCSNKYVLVFGDGKKEMLNNARNGLQKFPITKIMDTNTTVFTNIEL